MLYNPSQDQSEVGDTNGRNPTQIKFSKKGTCWHVLLVRIESYSQDWMNLQIRIKFTGMEWVYLKKKKEVHWIWYLEINDPGQSLHVSRPVVRGAEMDIQCQKKGFGRIMWWGIKSKWEVLDILWAIPITSMLMEAISNWYRGLPWWSNG